MKKICIIEDDAGISASLKLYLENSDFSTVIYETGDKASEFILEQKPDLVILDINLPVKDGITVCRELRSESNIPVIMLTARNSEIDRITGLETGADDYIAKPFSPRELLARIQSIFRRLSSDQENTVSSSIFENGKLKINRETNEVFMEDTPLVFTKNEFDILAKIAFARGNMVSRESLMKEVIGYDNYVYDRTIDTHIKNIRKKLGDKDTILTIRGKWYRFNM
jgi:DNA-binding response OmpR family regulator